MSEQASDWLASNQRYLSLALGTLKSKIKSRIKSESSNEACEAEGLRGELREVALSMNGLSALEIICSTFGLSDFEKDILLLCAGIEFDSRFAALCSEAQGSPAKPYPTFGMALTFLQGAHWSALTPAGPLRRWHLIEVGNGDALVSSPLRIDETVLHYLAGIQHLDVRLAGIVEPLRVVSNLAPSHADLASKIAMAWSRCGGEELLPVIQLSGEDSGEKKMIAKAACEAIGLDLMVATARSLPQSPGELEAFMRLWEREAALTRNCLLIDAHDQDQVSESAVRRLAEDARYPLVVSSNKGSLCLSRPVFTFDVARPGKREQCDMWTEYLARTPGFMEGHSEFLACQFDLSPQSIRNVCAEVAGEADSGKHSADFKQTLWNACRVQTRPGLGGLAQRIDPIASWDDIVLPEQKIRILRDMSAHVRNRVKVYDAWGFVGKYSQGLGLSALFSGPSGTGKTMAAEVLAGDLGLDLYRIDLSSVVSKYIGETEKNLKRVFDAAEEGGAVLLFDEADALFGKRSEVKDSHDRYANIEISYLLQRMEAYRGLAILTTNMKGSLDSAFLRRIRFLVDFPFPDASQREGIWKKIFPEKTPTEGLDSAKLSRLNVSGGNIKNIALYAAFLAADVGEPVRMDHILRAARAEYAKLEKPLTEAEIRGWG